MPKSQVREAIAAYLAPATSHIQYLSTVYQSLPKIANEQDLYNLQPAGQGLGAVIYAFIEGQSERRQSLGGTNPIPSGFKLRAYTVCLLCIFKSDKPKSVDGQVAFDLFIDSLTAYIEANRTANSTAIFQWGEGDTQGGSDLRFDFPVPKTVGESGVLLFQAVGRVTALEFLQT